jgi:hypothetical protein
MDLMEFLYCLFLGRCGHEAPEAETRTAAASAPTDVQPNTRESEEPPPTPESDVGLESADLWI